MKILHLASGDAWGGAERSLTHLATAQCRSDSVEALLFNEGQLASGLRTAGVPVSIVPEQGHSLLNLARIVRAHVDAGRFDVVHAHRYKEILIATLCCRRDVTLVATVHGLEPGHQMGLTRLVVVWATLGFARLRGVRIVAVSGELASRLGRSLLTRRVKQIPNPIAPVAPVKDAAVDDLRAQFGDPAERPLVGFVGRLEEVKGPDLLLDVAERVGTEVAFALIGGGSLEASIQREIEQRALGDRVYLVGEVPDARPYLTQFDVLALTSRHEGLPMILLEAAAAEVPVVSFDVGGVREVLDCPMATRVVPAGDVDALARALGEALRNLPAARAAAKRWSSAVSSRFELDAVVQAYQGVYRGVGAESFLGRVCAKIREVGPVYAFSLALARFVPSRVLQFGRIVLMRLDTGPDTGDTKSGTVLHRWGTERDLELLRAFGHTRETLEQRLACGDRPFLAEEDGRLLAYAWFRQKLHQEGHLSVRFRMDFDEVWLYDAMVDGECRGRGIYPRLLRAASHALATESVMHIWIAIDSLNRNSIAAHEQAGAREVHRFTLLHLLGATFLLAGRQQDQPRVSLGTALEFATRHLGDLKPKERSSSI